MQNSSSIKGILAASSLQKLLNILENEGYRVIGPSVQDGAVIYRQISTVSDLPKGITDNQSPGQYQLKSDSSERYFSHVVGPYQWKRFLYPPSEKLWSATTADGQLTLENPIDVEKTAFLGVRACEIQALEIQDKVFTGGDFVDHRYQKRRNAGLTIAVNCSHPADTCFCTSMDSGPEVKHGYDLLLTELGEDRHDFLIESGSTKGEAILTRLETVAATDTDEQQVNQLINNAKAQISRQMPENIASVLPEHSNDEIWSELESRCLSCGNCTLVCPTCFCSSVEDTTDLGGSEAERWRYWDSCFTTDFSYIHGGAIRQSGASRYRQWMTHKLSSWHEQFGSSGCTGCGRCITWCPVGIDITEEAAKLCDKASNPAIGKE